MPLAKKIAQKTEYLLLTLVMIVFTCAVGFNLFLAVEELSKDVLREKANADVFFAALFVTILSGFAVILLLFVKISVLNRARRENEEIVELLASRMAAIETSYDGIAITNPAGDIVYVNPALASFHGYGTGELAGQSWKILYPPDQADRLTAALDTLTQAQGKHCRIHVTGRHRTGRFFYQDVSFTALEKGGFVLVARDYTEIMEYVDLANKRLAAIEAARDGIGIVDREGNVSYVNRAFLTLHGLTDDNLADVVGHSWDALYMPRAEPFIKEEIQPVLERDGYWKGEANILRPDGRLVPSELSLTRLPDGGMIGTVRDISERKQAEKEKEDLQRQVHHAQKMEAIGRLAGGIAHDFNNILSSMLGYAEFLTEDLPPDGKQYSYAAKIMQGGGHARDLVEQLLAFSRQNESSKSSVDLVAALGEARAMIHSVTPSTIDIDLRIDAKAAPIYANENQISQILMNLCINSIDAMEEKGEYGRILLQLSAGMAESFAPKGMLAEVLLAPSETPPLRLAGKGGDVTELQAGVLMRGISYVRVRVEDTGTGMPRTVMEHMFEPFYTTKPVDKGTGLGLSSVHEIVAAHQGAMIVTSTPGKGTVFDLFFPMLDRAAMPEKAAPARRTAKSAGSGHHIMLVDDEAHVRDMLVQMLLRLGYRVSAFASAQDALTELRESHVAYDLVITDYMMPLMTGGELARTVNEEFAHLPIVMLSGYNHDKLRKIGAESPYLRAIVRKPVTSQSLSATLDEILSASSFS